MKLSMRHHETEAPDTKLAALEDELAAENKLAALENELAPQLRAMRYAARHHAQYTYQERHLRTPLPGSSGLAGSRRFAGLAAATALLAGSFGGWLMEHARPPAARPVRTERPAATTLAASTLSDEALLDSVQRDLRRGIPAALQPLALSQTPRPSPATSPVRKD